jgi:hypothetical protein
VVVLLILLMYAWGVLFAVQELKKSFCGFESSDGDGFGFFLWKTLFSDSLECARGWRRLFSTKTATVVETSGEAKRN